MVFHTDSRITETKLRRLTKKAIDRFAGPLGFELHRIDRKSRLESRATLRGCLEHVRSSGFVPETVIDVGAAYGTHELYEVFPEAYHLLIEPLEEFEEALIELVDGLDRAEYLLAAATNSPGQVTINVHPDLVGSSLYKEVEDSDVNGFERMVAAVVLDEVCRSRNLHGPYLIKVDTQGSELDVLQGAESLLLETGLVVLEISFFEFFEGGPQLHECIDFMKRRDFVAYDLFGLQYRPLDGAMSQVDIAFVPATSSLRQHQFYATPEQRDEQTRRMRERL